MEVQKSFIEKAKEAIVEYFNNHVNSTDKHDKLVLDDVFVVWQCKTLQNNKAILGTSSFDQRLYEFTWNGDKNEGYLDVYDKEKNILVK